MAFLFGKTKESYDISLNNAVTRATELAVESINRKLNIQKPTKLPFTVTLSTTIKRLFGKSMASNRSKLSHNSGYDMQRMISALETEPYVARVVDQLRMGVMQRGCDFVSKNADYANYIRKRFFEMEKVSNFTLRDHISALVAHTMLQGQGFITLNRNENASSGREWVRFDGKVFKPIAAIEVQDTTSMRINYDYQKNKLLSYYQLKTSTIGDDGKSLINWGGGFSSFGTGRKRNNESVVEWTPEDVVHMRWMPLAGKVWAMPPFLPVIDDILALREIEESVQLLIYQYGHPILHGTVDVPDPDAKQLAINRITANLEAVEGNGALVTGNEVAFTMIGSEGKAIQLEGYLAYFKARVLSGLYTSGISMGDGNSANRNSAAIIDKRQQEVIRELQTLLIDAFQPIIDDLLMEAGVSLGDIFENRVSLWFPDPDISTKIANEQHYMLLYQSNCITETEMRKELGRQALTEKDRESLYSMAVTEAEQERSFERTVKMAKITAIENKKNNQNTKTNSKGNSKTQKGQGAKKAAQQKVTPTNQYGKKSGPGSTQN